MAEEDPDYIAENPPTKATDPKQYFKLGDHADKWSEYDDRGVPTKSIKKKKPTKKEVETLEEEYLACVQKYQKWLKDMDAWEQSKTDAEARLQEKDCLRWAYRQIGDKNSPIDAEEDFPQLFKLMKWKPISNKEMNILKKGLAGVADGEGKVGLEALRKFKDETMPVLLMEERCNAEFEGIQVEDIYSPRSWRQKIGANPVSASGAPKKSSRGSVQSKSAKSASSPRGKAKKGPAKKK